MRKFFFICRGKFTFFFLPLLHKNSVFAILSLKVPLVRPLQNMPIPIQLINCTKYTEVVEREKTWGNNSTDILLRVT